MQAYRIVNWWRYEVLKNGKPAAEKTKMGALREKPLIYVRFPIHADKNRGHVLSADYRRMVKRAGPELAAACDGLYKMLVGLAGNQVREYRGWILDDRQQPLNPKDVTEFLCLSEEKVAQIFEVLTDPEVDFVEFLDFPESLRKSLKSNDLSGEPQIKKSGNNQELLGKIGIPLIETETEEKLRDSIRSESNRRGGVREKSGEVGSQEAGGERENAGQPQARPPASVPASDSDKVPVSDSEEPTVPVSDTDSVTDSVSGPAAGPGAAGPGPLSDEDRFEIIRECKKSALEFSQIIHLRNSSDITTVNDIFSQLKNRLLSGCPHNLFELSLNTARQCWRGDNPIAMFVAAMKKPPFYYVPKKLSVIPGKFSQSKNTNLKS